ncbi:MAG: (2Fe-2S)-binding protein [Aestuariivita sp.]|nr:(2Fe-2S)-binding protein [Aestuariivita sp.]
MGLHTIRLNINGQLRNASVRSNTLLADLLREDFRLTGVHIGCDTSQCGCCTIHLDGEAIKACSILAVQAHDHSIITIEGLASSDGKLHPVQQAMIDCHGLQCGFCTPGIVMLLVDFLRKFPNADEWSIRRALDGNLCRCTGYQHIIDAALKVVTNNNPKPLNSGQGSDREKDV